MANVVEQGIEGIKKLPPVVLIAVVAGGVVVGYVVLRKRSSDETTEVPTYQAEQLIALERGPVGALPSSIGGAAQTSIDESVSGPRRDPGKAAGSYTPIPYTIPGRETPNIPAGGRQPLGSGTPVGAPLPTPYNPVSSAPRPTAPTAPAPQPAAPYTPAPQPAAPYTPAPQPAAPMVVKYPGLPDNYQLNCSLAYKELHTTFDVLLAGARAKGINNTMVMRQLSQIAIGGFPKDEMIRGWEYRGTAGPAARAFTNQKRVFSGLYPLTDHEFDLMSQQMLNLWNGDEHATVFQSGTYARTLFAAWNAPYQCDKNAPPRRDR